LKFLEPEMHHIAALVENLPRFSEVNQMSVSTLKRFFSYGSVRRSPGARAHSRRGSRAGAG
jgi:hypothetical protein